MLLQKAFTVTQGGADTAAETTIPTLIQPGISLGAWQIEQVEFTIKPDLLKAWAGADMDFTLQLTKRSLSASIARLITYTDTDLIASFNLAGVAVGTVANFQLQPATFYVTLPTGLLVYAENVYAQLISTATGATNVVWGRLLYELVTLSRDEAFSIVATRP